MTAPVSSLEAILEFVDVGQGDATVALDLVGRSAIIIDCPSWGVRPVRDVLRRHNIGVVDAVFITHFDDDHFSGIPQLVRDYAPRMIYANPDTLLPDDPSFPKYRAALAAFVDLQERGISDLTTVTRDMAGTVGPIKWEVLAPITADVWKSMGLARPHRNIASSVIALSSGPVRAIIGGDAPLRTWTRIANERIDQLSADVFRLSHHGANMRSGRSMIDVRTLFRHVDASHAIISTGSTNRYGHPGAETIHMAREAGARVMCTEVTPACLGHKDRAARPAVAGDVSQFDLPSRCAGNIRVEVTADSWAVYPTTDDHEKVLQSWATPHCLVGCTSLSLRS